MRVDHFIDVAWHPGEEHDIGWRRVGERARRFERETSAAGHGPAIGGEHRDLDRRGLRGLFAREAEYIERPGDGAGVAAGEGNERDVAWAGHGVTSGEHDGAGIRSACLAKVPLEYVFFASLCPRPPSASIIRTAARGDVGGTACDDSAL